MPDVPLFAVGKNTTVVLTTTEQAIRVVIENPTDANMLMLTSEDAAWLYDSEIGMAKPITVSQNGSINFRTAAREFTFYAKVATGTADLHLVRLG